MMTKTRSRARSASEIIFEALCEHPLLSRRQLELYLHYSSAGVRYGLRQLRQRRLIWQVNARQPGIHARALYAPTQTSVAEWARQQRAPLRDFANQPRPSPERLNRIVLRIERVFQLRTMLLWLSRSRSTRAGSRTIPRRSNRSATTKETLTGGSPNHPGLWHAGTWDVEVGKLFSAKGKAVWIPFHGAALFERGPERSAATAKDEETGARLKDVAPSQWRESRWAFVVVELDTGRAPVAGERKRLGAFVVAQDDPRYWGKDKEESFPVLLVIAQDELRLQDYYTTLRSAALARHLPMPRAYLTTVREILSLRDDPTSPVWYSTISGRRTSLLLDTDGSPGPIPTQLPWRKLPLGETTMRQSTEKDKSVSAKGNLDGAEGLSELAQVSLKLTPIAKRLLDEIAAHPLLTRDELSLLLMVTMRWVKPALAVMSDLKLVQVHQERYLVAPKGEQYLAQTAGYGSAVRRYTRVRGWGRGFDTLLRYWEHSQEENKFFLRLARVAHERHHRLTWLSELEGRLYYEAGQRWHSFLPDGRGTYYAGKKRYEFALEIDRSRAPLVRFRGKLTEYDACINSNVLCSEGIEFLRVLVVTNSWERAEAWRRSALDVKVHFPVLITTFDRLEASGVDAPIWLRGEVASSERAAASPKVCCFECFGK